MVVSASDLQGSKVGALREQGPVEALDAPIVPSDSSESLLAGISQRPEDLAGDITLGAADHLAFGESFGGAASESRPWWVRDGASE